MSESSRVGGEVDALCTRCKMLLAHTVLAMVGPRIARVRCNTCQGEHNFHRATGERATPARATRTAAPRTLAAAATRGADLDSLLSGRDISQPLRYGPAQTYAKDDVLDHPTFGLGLVMAVRGEKLDVAFRAGVKTLAHGRGGGSGTVHRLVETAAEPGADDAVPDASEG